MSKIDRAKHGPGWGEVIFGAVLSLVLGVVVGAVLLILKPVVVAKEVPKEPVEGTIYYVEGIRGDATKGKQVLLKRKALADGQSIKLTEDEVNALVAATTAPKEAKPGEPAAQPKSEGMLSTGTPNVRIRNGSMQVAAPVVLNVFGFEQKIIAQARGGFEKQGDTFAYQPAEMYIGSCPVQRLPILAGYVRSKLLNAQPIPDDIASAWSKLTSVSIEGNALVLAMK